MEIWLEDVGGAVASSMSLPLLQDSEATKLKNIVLRCDGLIKKIESSWDELGNKCKDDKKALKQVLKEKQVCITPPPPPCPSHALVQATVGVGTVLIWGLISFGTKCSAATYDMGLVTNLPAT